MVDLPPSSMEYLLEKQRALLDKIPHGHTISPECVPSVIAGNGIIEEVLEYLNTLGYKSWRPIPLSRERQLEELVDILFFVLELILFSQFTWDEVVGYYSVKYEVNLERFERAKKGNWDWDDRATKHEL